MDWNTFVEGFKEFWNQPVPIIGFTVGMCIVGVVFIIGKTSIGKKALIKIKALNNELIKKNEELVNKCEELRVKGLEIEKKAKEMLEAKDTEIKELKNDYELKLSPFKEGLDKMNWLLGVICENSVNKKVKEAYENYRPEIVDIPVPEIEEKIKAKYDERIAKLEELVYGQETKDNQTTSE